MQRRCKEPNDCIAILSGRFSGWTVDVIFDPKALPFWLGISMLVEVVVRPLGFCLSAVGMPRNCRRKENS